MGTVLSPPLPQRQTPFFLDSRRITIHVSFYSVACSNTTLFFTPHSLAFSFPGFLSQIYVFESGRLCKELVGRVLIRFFSLSGVIWDGRSYGIFFRSHGVLRFIFDQFDPLFMAPPHISPRPHFIMCLAIQAIRLPKLSVGGVLKVSVSCTIAW